MIIKRAITRYVTYFSGITTTAISIFLINYFLNPNEFAVWGITNSLIYILAQLGQLTYVQYIEKYFPNMNDEIKKKTLHMIIKTTFVFSPLWFIVLVILDYLNYFGKFNISNIVYLLLMITISVVIEASIEIFSKYLLTKKETIQLDKNEFIYSKLLRLIIFTVLLINGFSIYHLLFTNILLRALLFIKIISLENEPTSVVFRDIIKSNIFINNFSKIKYTFVAFGIKVLLISFLNLLFLFYSSFATSETIAVASLGVLIINNLKPAIGSLTSLLSPMISENVEKSIKNTELINNFLFINSFSASVFLVVSIIFVYAYNYFFNIEALVGYNPDWVILVSISACTISSLYYPKLWHVKFANLENQLLKLLLSIFIATFLLFALAPFNVDLLIFYMLFEVLVYFACSILYKTQFPKFKNRLSPSLYISGVIVLFYLYNFPYIFLPLTIYIVVSISELKKVRKILNSELLN